MRKTTVLLWAVLSLAILTNARAQWVNTNLPSGTAVNALATNGAHLFAGTAFNGVFLTTDDGATWTAVNNGLTTSDIRALAVSGTTLFAGTYGGGVFRSTDSGASWAAVNNGMTNMDVVALAVRGNNIFSGQDSPNNLFLSTDNGGTWTQTGFVGGTVAGYYFYGSTLFAKGSDLFVGCDTVIAGIPPTYYYRVYRSADSGATWTRADNGLASGAPITWFAAIGNNLFVSTVGGGGVYISTDNGDSWTMASTGLTNTRVQTLAVSGTNLFAGTRGGVFLTTDSGSSWKAVNDSLTDMNITVLLVSNGYLFAGASSGNIWRRPISEMVAVQYAQGPSQKRNAPVLYVDNHSILKYTLPEAAAVTLKVFDIRGRLLHSSVMGKQPAGTYSAPLAAGRLSAGNYVLVFNAESFKTQRLFAVM